MKEISNLQLKKAGILALLFLFEMKAIKPKVLEKKSEQNERWNKMKLAQNVFGD